jgi:hypothetical protein
MASTEKQKAAQKRWREKNADKERARCREYYWDNKAVHTAKHKRWVEENPERVNELSRESYHKNKDKNRPAKANRTAWYVYGIDKEAMLAAQGYRCAACGASDPKSLKKGWAVDHCHDRNVVRAILCFSCNIVLGHVRDDVGRLEQLIGYLKKHQLDESKWQT